MDFYQISLLLIQRMDILGFSIIFLRNEFPYEVHASMQPFHVCIIIRVDYHGFLFFYSLRVLICNEFSRSTLLQSVGLLYMEHLSVCGYLIQSQNYNWLWHVMWHKNYWWHHSTLSRRKNALIITPVKVLWLRP